MEPNESIEVDGELEDGTERPQFSLARVDTALLTNPAVLRAIGGIAIGLAMLAWPDRSDRIVSRLVGLGVVWLALTTLRIAARHATRDWLRAGIAVISLIVGAVLVLNPDRSTVAVGRIGGALLIGYAMYRIGRALRTKGTTSRPDPSQVAISAVMVAIGFVLIVFTGDVIATVIAVGALFWIGSSLLVLAVSLDARTTGTASVGDTIELAGKWLSDRPKSVDARQALYEKILYEGPVMPTRVARFFTLMGFAAVIASMGVITDSTAVVIGAMLVAPLMTPLMGMAISLVMGWPNRLTRSAIIAFGGITFAILVGVLLGLTVPTVIDTATNSQIIARTSPTVLDLITAIAAGAAGAYGLSRPDVSDALPGVAIAISLVPPLSVVGIAYSQGDWAAGNGALLLFATNMVAILLVGGLTFIVTGVTPVARASENQHRVRTAVGVTCTAAVLVFGALLLNGAQIATNSLQQSTIDSTIDDWLTEDSSHRALKATINGNFVTAIIAGPSQGLPPVQDLADELSDELDKAITVNISLVVEESLTASAD